MATRLCFSEFLQIFFSVFPDESSNFPDGGGGARAPRQGAVVPPSPSLAPPLFNVLSIFRQ